MYSSYCQFDEPVPAPGVWAVPVPWSLVPLLTASPAARQIATALYIDPPTKRAAIVLWPGVDPRWVSALLTKLQRQYRRRAA
jgi:hypothetical protein